MNVNSSAGTVITVLYNLLNMWKVCGVQSGSIDSREVL